MTEALSLEKLRTFIDMEIDEFLLEDLRKKHQIAGDSPNFHQYIQKLIDQRYIKKVKRATYRKVKVVQPIKIFGRERRPVIKLNPPLDRETLEPLDFFDDIVLREGDLWMLSGFKNKGKTNMCMSIMSENLDKKPILMGNEYTIMGKDGEYEPSPRFLNRLDNMNWVKWTDGDDKERFELLPVYEDFAEQIRPGGFYIIDWINLPGEYYMISPVLEGIKRALGNGIAIVVLQKNPGSDYARGGNLSKDFADAEILLDPYGDDPTMTMLTVGNVKETKNAIMGHKFVYRIKDGVKITDFREVIKCGNCFGKGWRNNHPCDSCNKLGYVDKVKI